MIKKTVLITGCSSGFGREMVPAFLKRGWRVIATLRHALERTGEFRRDSADYPDDLIIHPLNVTDKREIDKAAELIRERLKRLDCLINNAGYGLMGAFGDLHEAQIREQMETNFLGPLMLTKSLLPFLHESRGRVINISSLLGFAGFPLASLYCASKFAMEGWSESLYYELKSHGVQISIVEPGGYRTRFAENMKWGEHSFSNQSPYAAQTLAYRKLRGNLAKRRPKPIWKMAEAICRLADMPEMPLRYQIDPETRVSHVLKKLLPGALFQNLWFRILGNIGKHTHDPSGR